MDQRLAKAAPDGHLLTMAHVSFLEQPLVVHMRPGVEMDDEQLYQFCVLNRDLQIERTADGDILIMAPEGGSSSIGGTSILVLFGQWAERDGRGQVFGSSGGFILPNGALRSPDVAWVLNQRLDKLTDQQWEKFLPLCPDFVLELRSPSDSLTRLQKKMEEYIQNGAQLGWLLDPETKQVHVYRPGKAPQVLDNPTTLTGEPLLQG